MLRCRERGVGIRFEDGMRFFFGLFRKEEPVCPGSAFFFYARETCKGFSELAAPILDIARKVINLCGNTIDGKREASF